MYVFRQWFLQYFIKIKKEGGVYGTYGAKAAGDLCRGRGGYCALETLWRGRTHPSMALCGGTVLAVFTKMVRRGGSRLGLCLRGCALITGCELLCGLVFNRDRQVWDYSRLPGNFRGQICPLFSALWFLLCIPLCGLCPLLERHLALLDKRGAGGL